MAEEVPHQQHPEKPNQKEDGLSQQPGDKVGSLVESGGSPGLCALIDLFLQGL